MVLYTIGHSSVKKEQKFSYLPLLCIALVAGVRSEILYEYASEGRAMK